jgi:hypothetical protein
MDYEDQFLDFFEESKILSKKGPEGICVLGDLVDKIL